VAKNIVKVYPRPPAPRGGRRQPARAGPCRATQVPQSLWRVDENLSEKHRFFVRASIYDRNSEYDNYFNDIGTGVHFAFPARAGVFDDIYTLSPPPF